MNRKSNNCKTSEQGLGAEELSIIKHAEQVAAAAAKTSHAAFLATLEAGESTLVAEGNRLVLVNAAGTRKVVGELDTQIPLEKGSHFKTC